MVKIYKDNLLKIVKMNTATGNYVTPSEASKILGVHQRTLYKWEEKGLIDTIRSPGIGKRFYNVEKYLKSFGNPKTLDLIDSDDYTGIDSNTSRLKIVYVRVSSAGQKDDLVRQITSMSSKYPDHVIIKDIGSGLNLNKRGLRKIIDLAITGRVEELVVAHRDRLVRFGFELIKDLVEKYSNGKLIVESETESLEPEEELVKDVLAVMNVFVARMNGLRKYKKKENAQDL
jgi:putative resolvase